MTRFGKWDSILLLFVIVALPNIVYASVEKSQEFSLNDDVESIPGEVSRNSRSKYHACRFKIDQSKLKNIVKLMHNSTTNVIELDVRIKSLNKTFNETRVLTEGIKWANEIGRTLISLTAQAENSLSMVLSSYTTTLTAGVYDANIVVSEVTGRCLLPKNDELNPIIFNILLRYLFQVSEDVTDYQLCRALYSHQHDVTAYQCCTIVGEKNIPICSRYSSIVTKIFLYLVVVTSFFLNIIAFPIILEYLSHFKQENTHYKISDSPMSLSSILRTVFIEGYGPGKSFGRKLLIAIFVFVTVLPAPNGDDDLVYSITLYVLCPWVLIFLFFDVHNLNDNDDRIVNNTSRCFGYVFEDPIAIIALPFNLKMWWRKVNNDWPLFYDHLKLNLNPERTRLLQQVDSQQSPQERSKFSDFIEIMKYRLSILFLLIFYVTIGVACLCLFSILLLNKYYSNSVTKKRGESNKLLSFLKRIQFVVSLTLVSYSFMKFLLLVFYFAVGLFLNGQVYGPYFVPVSTILFFSWINWRSSVETNYLVLNTKILEVCSESNPVGSLNQINENDGNSNVAAQASTQQYTINWNEKGDPIIPKELYEKVREIFLPYDKILFYYFQGVFFVLLFAYFLYIMLSLAQKSGVSESVQIIGAMAASTIPFIFDLLWKTKSDEQKQANDMSLKSKLKRVLVVRTIGGDSDEVIREISVEFVNRIENTSNTHELN